MKVHRVELRAGFYVLAANEREAEEAAKVACDFDELRACLPVDASPWLDVRQTPNQDRYMREKCANYDPGVHGSAPTGTGDV